ncbi:MAG TPA: hypothetical protein PLI47_07395, partial [Bacteroidia bacterium]|nr:hypothetical protein [Bacteroidia bacterium]
DFIRDNSSFLGKNLFPAELRRVRRITADFIRDNSSFLGKNLFPADLRRVRRITADFIRDNSNFLAKKIYIPKGFLRIFCVLCVALRESIQLCKK